MITEAADARAESQLLKETVRAVKQSAEEERASLASRAASLQQSLSAREAEVAALQERLASTERDAAARAKDKAALEAQLAENSVTATELGNAKGRLVRAEARVEELEALKETWKEEWARVKAGHRQQIVELTDAMQVLHAKLRSESQSRAGFEERCAELEERNRQSVQARTILETQLGQARIAT